MSAPVDREQRRRDLSDALGAMRHEQDVTGLDALAGSLSIPGPPYAFHGRLLQTGLAAMRRNYSALIWNLFQVRDKLERVT